MTDLPDDDNMYVTTAREKGADHSVVILIHAQTPRLVCSVEEARACGNYCAEVAVRARADAIAAAHMRQVGKLDDGEVGSMLVELRTIRSPLMSPYPFEFTAHVTVEGKPFIQYHPVRGETPLGQIDLPEFNIHVASVYMAAASVSEDDAYWTFLIDKVGLDEQTAGNVLADSDPYDLWRIR